MSVATVVPVETVARAPRVELQDREKPERTGLPAELVVAAALVASRVRVDPSVVAVQAARARPAAQVAMLAPLRLATDLLVALVEPAAPAAKVVLLAVLEEARALAGQAATAVPAVQAAPEVRAPITAVTKA